VDGGMLWGNGCDGKVLRCGAGNRHQHDKAQAYLYQEILYIIYLPETTSLALYPRNVNKFVSCLLYLTLCGCSSNSTIKTHSVLYNIILHGAFSICIYCTVPVVYYMQPLAWV
jgi:hypothetical protein